MTAATGTGAWLRRHSRLDDARLSLVCFPHAGGAASAYLPFAEPLAAHGIEVTAVQYPGRQDRRTEPAIPSITGLASAVAPLLAADGPPLVLLGHSMGATVAYETARLLPPVHLVVSARRPPTLPQARALDATDDAVLLAEVSRMQGTDPELLQDPELQEMILPALRADYRAVGGYVHEDGPRLSCPVLALAGEDDRNALPPDLTGWAGLTDGAFVARTFSGGHFFLTEQVRAVVRTLAAELA